MVIPAQKVVPAKSSEERNKEDASSLIHSCLPPLSLFTPGLASESLNSCKTSLGRRRVAVESEAVDGAAGKTADDVGGSRGLDGVAEGSGGLLAVESEQVGGEAGDVGRSHGGARDAVLFQNVSIYLVYGLETVEEERFTVAEVPPIQVLRMLLPGARISTTVP